MKNLINNLFLVILASIILLGCNSDFEKPADLSLKSELKEYLSSSQFDLFQTSFSNYSSNLKFNLLKKSELNENEVLYVIPTSLENSKLGLLNVVKSKDGSFKSFFELRTFSKDMQSATIEYFSVNGNLQFTVQGQREKSSQYYSLNFQEISSNARMNSCTGDCFKMATDACDGDGDCKILCALLDIAGGACTVSIAVACFVHCW